MCVLMHMHKKKLNDHTRAVVKYCHLLKAKLEYGLLVAQELLPYMVIACCRYEDVITTTEKDKRH